MDNPSYLDAVEVIGSVPVPPIVPFLNHIKPSQPFNSPSSTPVPRQFGNNLGTIKSVPIVPLLLADAHRDRPEIQKSQLPGCSSLSDATILTIFGPTRDEL